MVRRVGHDIEKGSYSNMHKNRILQHCNAKKKKNRVSSSKYLNFASIDIYLCIVFM